MKTQERYKRSLWCTVYATLAVDKKTEDVASSEARHAVIEFEKMFDPPIGDGPWREEADKCASNA